VIIDVLVAQRNPQHPLTHQGLNAVFNQFLAATIIKASGKALVQSNRPVRRPQQQGAGVRRDRSAIKTSHNFPADDRCKFKQVGVTLCLHRG
jgi:hypothetical protein